MVLAASLTFVTTFLFSGFVSYMISNSVTLSGLYSALIDIMGHRKYQLLSNFQSLLSNVFIFLTFIFYLILLFHQQKKRQYLIHLSQLMKEIHYIANGNLDHQIKALHYNELGQLATDVNKIVHQMKEALAEERRTEHTKNELITNVSHDIRTPLTSIIGYLGLIEQDRYRDEVELRHYTNIAYGKAQNLEQLTNELFEYTRMQDQKFILNKSCINMSEILGQIINENHLRFIEADMICREDIALEKMYVLGDGEKLARVFDNLITNAIHYGQQGKYIDISAEEGEQSIIVTVTNYGDPISSIDIPHLFDRFYRVEKSRSKDTGGSGLGLAIAKSIMTHHHGSIEVESSIEQTIFIVKMEKLEQNN